MRAAAIAKVLLSILLIVIALNILFVALNVAGVRPLSAPLQNFLSKYGYHFYVMSGQSMTPAIRDGQKIEAVEYKTNSPERGDIVVFKSSTNANPLVKRIIGLPGETIELKNGSVYINGNLLNEPYLVQGTITYPEDFIKEKEPKTIPADEYFLMGDNRSYSYNSRAFGTVKRTDIVGKVKVL